jgi:hypothetical protein
MEETSGCTVKLDGGLQNRNKLASLRRRMMLQLRGVEDKLQLGLKSSMKLPLKHARAGRRVIQRVNNTERCQKAFLFPDLVQRL